ncbi:hypothetical protein Pdsh_02030 [Pyrodictium delaneyi]|uniref:Uncharacterized protein n=1 Tax=Pyrodictium delaneyi TaxID=1273541 RepID=A0A211YRA2_9CREN|nr:hypothetical protein Pdsh_02030 [Pyrodictium delaneyi]
MDVVAEPEKSFLDEPLFYAGSFAITIRRVLYGSIVAVIVLLILPKLPPGPRVWLPGLEIEAGVVHIASLVLLTPFLYLLLVDKPVRPETQLLWLILGPKTRQRKAGKRREGKSREEQEEREELRVAEKQMRLRMREGLARFSFVVSVERPTRVQVLVDGAVYREFMADGERQVLIELDEPGGHTVEVRSTEPPAVLARYRVLVER